MAEAANMASRLIAMAISLVKSPQEVMAHMRCSAQDFESYAAGRKEPAQAELERLVALIIREQGRVITRNRDLLAEQRSRVLRKPNAS